MPAGTPSMVDFYRYIAPKLQRTVVFNGDTDPCVSCASCRPLFLRLRCYF